MMKSNEHVTRGWFSVAVVLLSGYGIRTVYDIQGLDMPNLLGAAITVLVSGLFAAQLVVSLLVREVRHEESPRMSLNAQSCLCHYWLDEKRIAHGRTIQRFPDDHVLGPQHYVDCPVGVAMT